MLCWCLFLSARACICSVYYTTENLQQLEEYDFIALVKITGDAIYKAPSKDDHETVGQLSFQIIELFKGKQIDRLLEYSKNSSCDIGISLGEEWLLFGRMIDNKLAVISCDRNEMYKEKDERRSWQWGRGIVLLKTLRNLYQHPVKHYENETRKEYYSNGQIEIEETYINGKRNGDRRIWYPNGVLTCKETYINDTLNGKAEWFFASGQLKDEFFYQKGRKYNVARSYYDTTFDNMDLRWRSGNDPDFNLDSLYLEYKRIQPRLETVYDSYGREIIIREYYRNGRISHEYTNDNDRNFRTAIFYHKNGRLAAIQYFLNGKDYGHYQSYDENGLPNRGWDYDENGYRIKNE